MPKTVFILGAGASAHLNYPIGDGLLTKIAQSERLSSWAENRSFYRELTAAQSPSIDNFLKSHEGNEEYLKLAKGLILHYILLAENKSLVEQRREGDWYTHLIDALESAVRIKAGSFDDVSFITFNYDRSLEYTLATRLLHRNHAKTRAEALKKIGIDRIVHMYGRVPYTPDEYFAINNTTTYPSSVPILEYGELLTAGNDNDQRFRFCLHHGQRQIKTFFETCEESQRAHDLLEQADHIIFLGCAYHAQNMEALKFDFTSAEKCKGKTIVGTSLRMSPTHVTRFNWRYGSNIKLFPVTCLELFEKHFVLGAKNPIVEG